MCCLSRSIVMVLQFIGGRQGSRQSADNSLNYSIMSVQGYWQRNSDLTSQVRLYRDDSCQKETKSESC